MRLEARGVTYRYGKESPMILEDFNFQMDDAERVGICLLYTSDAADD